MQDQDKAAPQSEIRKLVTRWAADTRHLFKEVLPALDRFEALQAGTQKLFERIADLERENEQVRGSRDELQAGTQKLFEGTADLERENEQVRRSRDELQAATQTLFERIADLERENEQVRRSRDELAATLSKVREFVFVCTGGDAQGDSESESLSSQGAPEPQAPNLHMRPLSAFYRPTSPTPGARSSSVRRLPRPEIPPPFGSS